MKKPPISCHTSGVKVMDDENDVSLRLAAEWTCPECGTDQFERLARIEMSPEDLISKKEQDGVLEGEGGMYVLMPEEVTCDRCGNTYKSVEPEED